MYAIVLQALQCHCQCQAGFGQALLWLQLNTFAASRRPAGMSFATNRVSQQVITS